MLQMEKFDNLRKDGGLEELGKRRNLWKKSSEEIGY